MDGLAIRPVLWEMGQRLADSGYLVLLPDLFYRSGPYAPMNPAEIFSDPVKRDAMRAMVSAIGREQKLTDTRAFLDYLASRSDVKGDRYGATGYCMGGNMALTAAGAFPERFACVASFHGGNLATDQPDSPHAHIAGFGGYVYVAGAIEDASFPEEQKLRLEAALTEASVPHEVVTYEGAHHGFTMTDVPVYNRDAAERHWAALLTLLGETLAPA
jgi:carboxymethylenebutenolidase